MISRHDIVVRGIYLRQHIVTANGNILEYCSAVLAGDSGKIDLLAAVRGTGEPESEPLLQTVLSGLGNR